MKWYGLTGGIATGKSTVSRMLADELIQIVKKTRNYEQAKRYALAAIETGFHGGGQRVSRDELHER